MFIDPHVHCRDADQAYKETIPHALSVAERAGFTAIFDIPNLTIPVTRREQVIARLELAKNVNAPVMYGMYILLTKETDQIKTAVKLYNEYKRKSDESSFVVGFKLFCGKSVGDCTVSSAIDQVLVWKVLADSGYNGVTMVHCEEEDRFHGKFDPANPVSHATQRCPGAEVASVENQIEFALNAGYKGTLHVGHVSVPQSVNMVNYARRSLSITCGVTPHHLLFNIHQMEEKDGLLYKMNPPLRPLGMNARLLTYLKDGKIDWVETDHAPHSLEEKVNPPYLSGIPGLPFYPRFIQWLKGHDFPDKRIQEITFERANEVFKVNLQPRKIAVDPGVWKELASEYSFDPYKDF